jgi:predicted nucleic acid-binding protein
VDKPKETKKKMVESALSVFAQLRDIELCTSMGALTEMLNILVSSKKLDRADVWDIESQLVGEWRLPRIKIQIVEVNPDKGYDFSEFFYQVKQSILKFHSEVGDVIHSVSLRNNGITEILTFDEKDDFKQIPGLTVFHPEDIRI